MKVSKERTKEALKHRSKPSHIVKQSKTNDKIIVRSINLKIKKKTHSD